MKAPVPPVIVKQVEEGEMFIPDVEKIMGVGGFARYGYKLKVAAECYAKNLELAWELGWNAREEKFKTDMNLSD